MDTKDACAKLTEIFKEQDLSIICSNSIYNKIKQTIIENKK